jgi:hypothetical protein
MARRVIRVFTASLSVRTGSIAFWLERTGILSPMELSLECERMIDALNTKWRRRELQWKTPAECWQSKPPCSIDRRLFQAEVNEELRKLLAPGTKQQRALDDAQRVAVERVLTQHKLLTYELGGWC